MTRVAEAAGYEYGKNLAFRSLLSKVDPSNAVEVHDSLIKGIPFRQFSPFLTDIGLPETDVAAVLGISSRTLRRAMQAPDSTLGVQESSQLWKLAETLDRAAAVFGSRAAAQHWVMQPAMGLNQKTPLDLLRSSVGAELVMDFLGRLEYGVYS